MTDEYWLQEATRLSLLEQDLWKSMKIIIDADAPNMPQEVPERRPDEAVVNNQVAAEEKKASQVKHEPLPSDKKLITAPSISLSLVFSLLMNYISLFTFEQIKEQTS